MSCSITEEAIFPEFQKIVARSLRVDPEQVTPEKSLTDLGAESLDLIEIAMESESAFNVWIPEKSILFTAKEVFGENAIVRDGMITDFGRRMLAERVRPEDARLLEGDLSAAAVESYFLRVGAWVTMLANLAQRRPVQCDQCSSSLKSIPGFRLKCSGCSKEFQIRCGDDLNLEWLREYESKYLPAFETQQPDSLTQTA